MAICPKCGQNVKIRYSHGKKIPLGCRCSRGKSSYGYAPRAKVRPQGSSRYESPPPRLADPTKPSGPYVSDGTCFWCSAKVLHYRGENGSYVLFDSLGKPWHIHPCWEEHYPKNKAKPKILRMPAVIQQRQMIDIIVEKLQKENQPLVPEHLAKALNISIIEAKNQYSEYYTHPPFTDLVKCPWCSSYACCHTSNWERCLFDSLGRPFSVHKCWEDNVESEDKSELLNLSVSEFSLRVLEGVMNQLIRSKEKPTENAFAKRLNISVESFREAYKGLYELSRTAGKRVILKKSRPRNL
jgi:hypothetical protein